MSLSLAHSVRRLDSWQQSFPALGIPVAVIKKIFAARASVEGQRRVYAPGVTSPLSYARTTA